MSVLVGKNTRVLVQGLTGREGSFHAQQMLDYGTKVVGGVRQAKAAQSISAFRFSIPFQKQWPRLALMLP